MERPTGVTVISIFQFIGAAFCVLFAIGLFVGGSIVGAILGTASGAGQGGAAGMGLGMLIGAVGGVLFVVVAALHVLVGWGMWTLKNWARMVTLVLAAIGAAGQAFGVLGSLMQFRMGSLVWSILMLGLNALVVWYLVQPHVKAAFENAPLQARAAGM